jgi:hypothetical protein
MPTPTRDRTERGQTRESGGVSPKDTTPPKASLYKDNTSLNTTPKGGIYKDVNSPNTTPKASLYKENKSSNITPKAPLYKGNTFANITPKAALHKDKKSPNATPKASLYKDNNSPNASSFSDDSGTLNGDVSPTSPTATRGTFNNATSSPITSPTTSTADTLNSLIESSFFKNNSRYFDDKTSPRNNGQGIYIGNKMSPRNNSQSINNSDKSATPPSEPARYKVNRNSSNPYPPTGGVIGGVRTSRTWVSQDNRYMHEFTLVRNAMRRLFKNADVAKWRYGEYIAHREAMLASGKNTLRKAVSQKEHDLQLRIPPIDAWAYNTLDELLRKNNIHHNLQMEGNTSRVLGEKTIWCVDWMNGKDEVAPWPTVPEMKWEGDDRAKTGVGRFPAIPREVGAPGIQWNQLQAVEVYPLDQVWRVPQMDDILLPVDEISEEEKPDLILTELEMAIDEYLKS